MTLAPSCNKCSSFSTNFNTNSSADYLNSSLLCLVAGEPKTRI